jgi:hypothetical protein
VEQSPMRSRDIRERPGLWNRREIGTSGFKRISVHGHIS